MRKLTGDYLHWRAKSIQAYDDWIFLRTSKADPGTIRMMKNDMDVANATVRQLKNHLNEAIPKFPGEHWPMAELLPNGNTGLPIAGVWKFEKAELILPNGVRD